MNDQRGRRGEARTGRFPRHRLEQNALLRNRVGRYLSATEQMIESLRKDLAQCREQNQRLTRERDRLHQRLVAADLLRSEHAESESRRRESEHEHRRGVQVRQRLERDQRELSERCAELEAALEQERAESRVRGLEAECLQEQIDELRQIVDLLTCGDEIAES